MPSHDPQLPADQGSFQLVWITMVSCPPVRGSNGARQQIECYKVQLPLRLMDMEALTTRLCLSVSSWEHRGKDSQMQNSLQVFVNTLSRGDPDSGRFMKSREEEPGAAVTLPADPGPEEEKLRTARHISLTRFPTSTAFS